MHVDPDKLFGRHLAILGNTGSGKSCSVSGLINWSLAAAKKARDGKNANARFIVLDPNGEYSQAFDASCTRVFHVEPDAESNKSGKPLRVPAWLWNGEEWAAFSGAAPGTQRPVLFDALIRLRSGLGPPDQFETRVKSRTARYVYTLEAAIGSNDHQKPGRREGVAETLRTIDRDFQDLAEAANKEGDKLIPAINKIAQLASQIENAARGRPNPPGYWHQIFPEADLDRLIQTMRGVLDELGVEGLGEDGDVDAPIEFRIEDLPGYVSALASDRYARDLAQFVDTLNLRIRSLFNRKRLSSIIDPTSGDPISLEEWLGDHIGNDEAQNGQITIVDLSLVPPEVIHVVVSVIARMVFEGVQRYRRHNRNSLPTVLVLDEAHTFIHGAMSTREARPAARACAQVFERIAREGRKFGLGLVPCFTTAIRSLGDSLIAMQHIFPASAC